MSKLVILFIILTGILFSGIFTMMKPSTFISLLPQYQKPPVDQSLAGRSVPKEIIVLGSTFAIFGLVGLSILGFRIFNESKGGVTRE
jgi:hypothetical protein